MWPSHLRSTTQLATLTGGREQLSISVCWCCRAVMGIARLWETVCDILSWLSACTCKKRETRVISKGRPDISWPLGKELPNPGWRVCKSVYMVSIWLVQWIYLVSNRCSAALDYAFRPRASFGLASSSDPPHTERIQGDRGHMKCVSASTSS